MKGRFIIATLSLNSSGKIKIRTKQSFSSCHLHHGQQQSPAAGLPRTRHGHAWLRLPLAFPRHGSSSPRVFPPPSRSFFPAFSLSGLLGSPARAGRSRGAAPHPPASAGKNAAPHPRTASSWARRTATKRLPCFTGISTIAFFFFLIQKLFIKNKKLKAKCR